VACYIPRWNTRPKTVTHPSTNRARRALTSFMRRTPLTTTPRRQPELCRLWILPCTDADPPRSAGHIVSPRDNLLLNDSVVTTSSSLYCSASEASLQASINQSINSLKAKGPNGHLHRSKIHDIKYINTHKHTLLRIT